MPNQDADPRMQQRFDQENEKIEVSHSGENDIGVFGMNEANELKPCATNPRALQTVHLYPSGNGWRRVAIFGDQAEMNLEVLWVEITSKMRCDSFGAAAAKMRNYKHYLCALSHRVEL